MESSFPWEPQAARGPARQPHGYFRIVALVGLGDYIPQSALEDEGTFVWRIDPAAKPSALGKRESVTPNVWGDVLRLPTAGAYSHDPPEIPAVRRTETHWYGNASLFPTVYHFIVAVASHRDDSTYTLVRRTEGGEEVLGRPTNYHPLSGTLPAPGTFSQAEGACILAILLGVIQSVLAMTDAGFRERSPAWVGPGGPEEDSAGRCTMHVFHENQYSTFSTHTDPMVLLISYYRLSFTGQGTVQDRFDSAPPYRYAVYRAMEEVMLALMSLTGSPGPLECARALGAYFAGHADLAPRAIPFLKGPPPARAPPLRNPPRAPPLVWGRPKKGGK